MATSQQIEMAARAPAMRATPWMLSHRDEERERAITAIPSSSGGYEVVARRERVKAALTLLLNGAGDLLDAIGIPADETAIARQVHDRLHAP